MDLAIRLGFVVNSDGEAEEVLAPIPRPFSWDAFPAVHPSV